MSETRRFLTALFVLVTLLPATLSSAADPMKIYFLDMMGGASTLIVTPLGESVLIDTGSREPMHRDADRILRAAKDAGLTQIDTLVTTHFHSDHYGGILRVTELIPVRRFIDKRHLPPQKERERPKFHELYALYQEATGGQVDAMGVGDEIPLKSDSTRGVPPIRLFCVAAERHVMGFHGDVDAPVEGFEMSAPDESDNGRSIALVLEYGDFRMFAGGDITRNVELHLAHPNNVVGQVDVYQVTHHGLDMSNNPVLLAALAPTVCIAMNGPKKGIQPETFAALHALPNVPATYQIHYNQLYGDEGNVPIGFIANGKDTEKGAFIKVEVRPATGEFSVALDVDGPIREYPIRKK